MKHPSIDTLALFAGGELPILRRWSTQRHVRECDACQAEVRAFQETSRAVAAEAEGLPEGVQWESLAAEMRANIHLGLEASEAIAAYKPAESPDSSPGLSWRTAALATAAACVLMFFYWTGAVRKQEQIAALRAQEPVIVEASERGVGLSDGAKELQLTSPSANRTAALVSVSTNGSAGARYIDEDSGQITVNNVYLD